MNKSSIMALNDVGADSNAGVDSTMESAPVLALKVLVRIDSDSNEKLESQQP